MKLIFDDIVQYLKAGNWVTAAQLMGAICHFAADATMPLHSTYDYWIGGMHTTFEGVANSHSNSTEMSVPTNYVPQYLDDITNAALVTLAGSFDFTDEDPNGGPNLSDFLEVGTTWNDWIKSMTENRIRAAVQFTANVWYTAMVQAGLVSTVTSSVDAITPYWKNSIPFTITATASENSQSVSLYYRHSTDNSSWGGWTFFENDYSSPYSWSFTTQGNGYYGFYSIARKGDNVESPPAVADAMCVVDRVAPASSIDVISPYWWASTSFQITATASDATSGVKTVSLYYRHSGDNANWDSWAIYVTSTASPWKWSFTAPSGNGYYEFYSIAVDMANNAEQAPTAADARCGVDTVAPASSIDVISPYWWTSTSFQITATASDATSGVKDISLYYRYSTDNSSWSAWALYGTDTVAPWMWSVVAPSGNGYYEFYSIARDKATNAESAPTEADTRCRIDIAGPPAPAKSSPADGTTTNNNKPTFTWSATTGNLSGIARYELWVDDNLDFSSPEILENTDNVTTSYTSTIELLNGNYLWRVRAWDQAGNPSPFEQAWIFAINTTPSVVRRGVEVSISLGSWSGTPGASLTYTVTVTNTGNVTEDYNLSATDNLGWDLTLPSSITDVAPGRDRRVTLIVEIPDNAADGDSSKITVTATSSENTEVENSASCMARCVEIVADVTSLTISPSRFALFPGYSGQVQSLTATLRVGNNPLPNKQITWSVTAGAGSVSPSSGTTDALGQVSVVYTASAVTDETSQVTITASFAGDNQYQASSENSLGIPATRVIVNISSTGGTVVITVIEINVTVNLLVVPENALFENTAIDVVQKPPENLPTYVMVSNIFDIGPNGTNFNMPSTLTLPYNENEIPLGMSEDNLAIYRRISGGDGWELVGGNVDKATNTISVQINHLSEYAVMASIGGSAAESGGLPLLTIGVIIAVILIIAVIAIFIRRR
jgi:uncharacterized repeat protein (TIGR01451 family)